MSEFDPPPINEATPEEIAEIVNQIRSELGLSAVDEHFPFQLNVRLTTSREVDISVLWDFDSSNAKDIAIILHSLTQGGLIKQIIMALNLLASKDPAKMSEVTKILRRWSKIREEGDDRPYIDSFQPLMPEHR